MKRYSHLIVIAFLLFAIPSYGQDEKPTEEKQDDLFKIDTPVTVELEKEEFERVEAKKKREKRNTFYESISTRWKTSERL